MKTYKKYTDIPNSIKIKVYDYFSNNHDNSIPTILKEFPSLTKAFINRIITEKLYENPK